MKNINFLIIFYFIFIIGSCYTIYLWFILTPNFQNLDIKKNLPVIIPLCGLITYLLFFLQTIYHKNNSLNISKYVWIFGCLNSILWFCITLFYFNVFLKGFIEHGHLIYHSIVFILLIFIAIIFIKIFLINFGNLKISRNKLF